MSRIMNCDAEKNCKPWRAPNLGARNEDDYDFKIVNDGKFTHNEQQEKIRQQSYEKSYVKGYMEGLAKGQEEINVHVRNIQALLASLAMPLSGLDDQVVDELVQLCMITVKQLIRRELKTSPGEIVAVVREALSLLPDTATDITLELHPEDAKILRETLALSESNPSWNISEDVLLSRGGCRVLTNSSRIDATIEKRINTVIAEVMGSERKMDDAE